ncbi:probable protein phosphatase 2C 27 isoform X1 [Vigna unguiculata]|uniref:protein-serine/threonine phosphatase n=2 Tax=Vigna unguiculata TaxID=3917 RepID=A0A4D6NWK2_VIGUN|nr:probable protein phosphatase 2C 27 isoform X1 [Vigna unguiculata]XP_027902895.1 probable protein phosphatase 2C 27 isoform X1 [Vigna unguiculata]QCE16775.1 protein phosphatase [Vigna unguiculata]
MYDLGVVMPVGMNLPPPFTVIEDKDSAFPMEDDKSGDLDNLKPMTKGKPPRHVSSLRHSVSTTRLMAVADLSLDVGVTGSKSSSEEKTEFLPIFRSGSCAERGPKQYMEDEHVCIDDLIQHMGPASTIPLPGAFYGVFDGHGGTDAALFIRNNILKFIVEDSHFPTCVGQAITSAFLKADYAFADSSSLDISSGTTALTALVSGRNMIVANAGDCRAVLGRRGRAIEMSKDQKPDCISERLRIEKLGGVVYDGYLNGQLSVSRALGDWHMKGPKGSACPLSSEPELQEIILTEDDEFLIMGCDGLWDVMSNQFAVTMARKELMIHNDPQRCSRELVREALKRNSCDNLTVIVICFSPDPPPRIETPPSRVRRSISAEGLNLLKGVLDS